MMNKQNDLVSSCYLNLNLELILDEDNEPGKDTMHERRTNLKNLKKNPNNRTPFKLVGG